MCHFPKTEYSHSCLLNLETYILTMEKQYHILFMVSEYMLHFIRPHPGVRRGSLPDETLTESNVDYCTIV